MHVSKIESLIDFFAEHQTADKQRYRHRENPTSFSILVDNRYMMIARDQLAHYNDG